MSSNKVTKSFAISANLLRQIEERISLVNNRPCTDEDLSFYADFALFCFYHNAKPAREDMISNQTKSPTENISPQA